VRHDYADNAALDQSVEVRLDGPFQPGGDSARLVGLLGEGAGCHEAQQGADRPEQLPGNPIPGTCCGGPRDHHASVCAAKPDRPKHAECPERGWPRSLRDIMPKRTSII
jgi:hypothetical protein